jgi:hypothetical protein
MPVTWWCRPAEKQSLIDSVIREQWESESEDSASSDMYVQRVPDSAEIGSTRRVESCQTRREA